MSCSCIRVPGRDRMTAKRLSMRVLDSMRSRRVLLDSVKRHVQKVWDIRDLHLMLAFRT